MSSKFEQWMDGETDDLLLHMTDTAEVPDSGRADRRWMNPPADRGLSQKSGLPSTVFIPLWP